jgi:hypothetical protein
MARPRSVGGGDAMPSERPSRREEKPPPPPPLPGVARAAAITQGWRLPQGVMSARSYVSRAAA